MSHTLQFLQEVAQIAGALDAEAIERGPRELQSARRGGGSVFVLQRGRS